MEKCSNTVKFYTRSLPPTANPPLTSPEATSVTSLLADFQKYLYICRQIVAYYTIYSVI